MDGAAVMKLAGDKSSLEHIDRTGGTCTPIASGSYQRGIHGRCRKTTILGRKDRMRHPVQSGIIITSARQNGERERAVHVIKVGGFL
jgi:hypothetical protein